METITKFKAIDGREFNDKDECVKYELLIDRVNSIMNTLPNTQIQVILQMVADIYNTTKLYSKRQRLIF